MVFQGIHCEIIGMQWSDFCDEQIDVLLIYSNILYELIYHQLFNYFIWMNTVFQIRGKWMEKLDSGVLGLSCKWVLQDKSIPM